MMKNMFMIPIKDSKLKMEISFTNKNVQYFLIIMLNFNIHGTEIMFFMAFIDGFQSVRNKDTDDFSLFQHHFMITKLIIKNCLFIIVQLINYFA